MASGPNARIPAEKRKEFLVKEASFLIENQKEAVIEASADRPC